MATPSKKFLLKNDTYSQARGEPSLLKITCSGCNQTIMHYQKDGPGPPKRCYFDRIFPPIDTLYLNCPSCQRLIGAPVTYVKEKRGAFHLIEGSVAF